MLTFGSNVIMIYRLGGGIGRRAGLKIRYRKM